MFSRINLLLSVLRTLYDFGGIAIIPTLADYARVAFNPEKPLRERIEAVLSMIRIIVTLTETKTDDKVFAWVMFFLEKNGLELLERIIGKALDQPTSPTLIMSADGACPLEVQLEFQDELSRVIKEAPTTADVSSESIPWPLVLQLLRILVETLRSR